jgi:tetratricopeptide (TPR) repeat protein
MRGILSILFILSVRISSPIIVATQEQSSAAPAAVEALLKQGKVHEALPLLLQLHQSQPQNSQVCLQLGAVYTQLQQLDKAVDFYTKALKINPGITPARRNLATVLWFLNQKEESVREFSRLLKTYPNDSVAHFYLGTFEYERKQFLKARDHFARAGDLASGNPEAIPMVLETYLAAKDMTVPHRLMRQLEQAEKPNSELILQVGTLLNTYGVYDEAIKAFEKLTSANAAKPEVYLLLAEAYDKQGKPDDAYRALAKAIELEPNSEEGYLALASFSSAHHNNEFALKVVGQGLEKIQGSSRLLLQQGVLWALEGDVLKAERSFQQASQANPQWSLPQLALGVSQLQAGRLAQAAETFQKVIKQDSSDYRAEYLYALALTRAGAQGDTTQRNEIIAALRRAAHLNPKDAESRVLLGQTYLAAGQLETAITELRRAIELNPRNPAAYYQLGVAYRKQGRQELAQRQLRTFEELKAQLKEEENEEQKALIQMLKIVKEK